MKGSGFSPRSFPSRDFHGSKRPFSVIGRFSSSIDPQKIHFPEVVEAIRTIEQGLSPLPSGLPDIYEIPTVYGGSYGPDLKRVSEITGLSPEEVIDLYSSTTFTIYFLGFLCAQPYLGGPAQKLHVPRLDNPRLHMPAGSVGIGGIQASLLTIDQPSGHNFIGRTFLSLYDPRKMPPTLSRQGTASFLNRSSEEEDPGDQGERSDEGKRRIGHERALGSFLPAS